MNKVYIKSTLQNFFLFLIPLLLMHTMLAQAGPRQVHRPHITQFSPTSGGKGTNVLIHGTSLTGITSVSFGHVAARSFTVLSDSLIHAVVGTGASGKVLVSGPNGKDSLAGFTFTDTTTAAKPVISSFSPDSGRTGTVIAIHGKHFTGATAIKFGGTAAASFTVNSDSLIHAVVGSGSTGYLKVVTPGGRDSAAGFVYIPQVAVKPVISSFSPDSGRTGTIITIYGKHFTGATSIKFGGKAAASFTVVSDSIMHAVVGSGSTGYITVVTPGGRDSAAGFTYIRKPVIPPVITYFTPTSAGTGSQVLIHGSSLTGITGVRFGHVAAQSFSVIFDTLISAVVGTGASGQVWVGGLNGADSLAGFTYIDSIQLVQPVIFSFSPQSGRRGDIITINGTHFTGAISVNLGGTAGVGFTVVSDSIIQVVVGSGSTGNITVVTPGGQASAVGFTYVPALAFTGFSPTSGGKGAQILLHGAGLTGITAVSFGQVPAQSFTVVSDTLISAIVGTGASGQVFIGGPNGIDSLPGFTFTDSIPVVPPAFQLVQFTGHAAANQAVLQWQTLHEQAIAWYIVEQGTDSTKLSPLSSIKAQGQDSALYTFTDTASRTGINYYQLKIEDTLGHFMYSNIIVIQMTGIVSTLSGRPNPAIGSMTVAPPSTLKPSTFKLVDMYGNVARTTPVGQNVSQVSINLSGLVTGIYKLIWSDGVNFSYQTILVRQ